MTSRTQESPFRETEWDQRLDKMLDDLKTTVTPDSRPSSRSRDNALVSSFRSSSRSDSRGSRGGVEDGGQMRHKHNEYLTPDNTRVVSDQYEYDSGDTRSDNKFQKKVIQSTYSTYKVKGDLTSELDDLQKGPTREEMDSAAKNTKGKSPYTNEYFTSKYANKTSTLERRPSDDDPEDQKGNEVRRIVWRNRFEKTCEAQDSTAPRMISIEEAAKAAERARNQPDFSFNKTDSNVNTLHNLNHLTNTTSPGGPVWPDPIPIPTPPQQLSPGEPGVAYVYTYGSGNTNRIQHLPPLNYVTLPPPSTMPTSDGAPSPTPSSASNQPIIYHYSYHYTIQPGQNLPEGVPRPSDGGVHPHPPALQMAPPPEQPKSTQYNVNKNSSSTAHNTNTSSSFNRQVHSTSNTSNYRSDNTSITDKNNDSNNPNHSLYSRLEVDDRTRGKSPTRLSYEGHPAARSPPARDPHPSSPGGPPNSNINITVNKHTTHTTTNRDLYPGTPGYNNGPVTSTPFPTPGRSRSTSPDKSVYPRHPDSTTLYPVGHPLHSTSHHSTYTSIHRTNKYSDSLDRVKRPNSEGLPFPETSPIKGTIDTRIPRRLDDLMTSIDSEDGPGDGYGPNGRLPNGRPAARESEPLVLKAKETKETELNIDYNSEENRKLELTKNKVGAPVYYPPGHQQLFSDAMHTMTLKEGKRRGMAKWRMEKASGYKESSSGSESKAGMAMVPVCLPLCCGAACTIM